MYIIKDWKHIKILLSLKNLKYTKIIIDKNTNDLFHCNLCYKKIRKRDFYFIVTNELPNISDLFICKKCLNISIFNFKNTYGDFLYL